MIKVSIIVPVYDQHDLVLRALKSIPIRDDIETIVVMNGVDNKMRGLVYGYCQDESFFKVIDVKETLGCWGAMNLGLENAQGEYIYQLDEDDCLETNSFIDVIENHLGSDLVYVNLRVNDGSIWELTESNRGGLPDHTSLIKQSFLGDDKFVGEGPTSIGGGYKLFQKLLQREHSRTFTGIMAYNYNYPRVNSLYYNATHK